MKTSIIRIGNSKGIRIPKALLASSKIGTSVILQVKDDGSILIMPDPSEKTSYNEEYLLSLNALDNWNDPREDEAWAHLQ